MKYLFAIPFYLVLRPLIIRNYRLRQEGKLPDEWYWADRISAEMGYFVCLTEARMSESLLAAVWKPALLSLLLAALIMLNACTVVRYTDGQKSLTIADLRISGSAIDLDATLNQVGSLSVNREQGSQGEAVSNVIEVLP